MNDMDLTYDSNDLCQIGSHSGLLESDEIDDPLSSETTKDLSYPWYC